MEKCFTDAVSVLTMIEEAGFEAYFVGGSVRDHLLGKPINDVDIASSATPEEIKAIFPRTADIGIEHGTVLVLQDKEAYEITTFRTESGYSDFRRPDQVNFVRSLEEDLKRRDFTMNAIAMDKNGAIIDPFSGRDAILEKRIVTVGNPDERFHEDALRLMRAVRFVSQLSFMLEDETYESVERNAHMLKNIAVERIHVEFSKLLHGTNKKKAIKLLLESGLYSFLPGLRQHRIGLEQLQSYDMEPLTEHSELWALLLYTAKIDKSEEFLRSWKMSAKQMKEIKKISENVRDDLWLEPSNFAVFQAGLDEALKTSKVLAVIKGLDEMVLMERIRKQYESLIIHTQSELAVTGTDLINWEGKPAGPWVKEQLHNVLDAVLNHQVKNDKNVIEGWFKTCNRK